MDNKHIVILQLLKVALDNYATVDYDASKVDWNSVMDYANQQGVFGVAFGAFEKLPLSFRPDRLNLIQWYGKVNLWNDRYEKYEVAISQLCKFFGKHGLKTMIMKGYGCSLNYPVPSHRPCGDIDIWMFGKQMEADKLIETKGLRVHYDNDHHSVFKYRGFTVENHQTIMDANKHSSNFYVNNLLEKEARNGLRTVENGEAQIYLPSDRFNAIHLLRHMASDFASVKTTLRHVLDWSTFVSKHEVDWNFVHEVANKAKMNKFLDALNEICVDYLGYPSEMFPVEVRNGKLTMRVLNDILTNTDAVDAPESNLSVVGKVKYGIHKTSRLWRNRWKHEIVFDESIFESFVWKAKNRWNTLKIQ